jgi:hypothetical protein
MSRPEKSQSPNLDQMVLPEFERRTFQEAKVKTLGKQDDKMTENATKLALERYERELA